MRRRLVEPRRASRPKPPDAYKAFSPPRPPQEPVARDITPSAPTVEGPSPPKKREPNNLTEKGGPSKKPFGRMIGGDGVVIPSRCLTNVLSKRNEGESRRRGGRCPQSPAH